MSIIAFAGSPNLPKLPLANLKTSQAYVKDSLLFRDTTNSVLIPVTASTGTFDNIEAIFTDEIGRAHV